MLSPVRQTLFAFPLALALFLPFAVSADTLFLSPTSGSYSAGQTFAVRIIVSSQQAINAVSGVLDFPSDKLQVTSVSKSGSILSLWVQEPSFSNIKGTVSFEGVVPNPGFVGQNGRILTVNFRVLSSGNANLKFTSGSLLANDGYGTNILRTLGTSSLDLTPATSAPSGPAETETSPEDVEPEIIEEAPVESPKEELAPSKDVSFDLPSLGSILNFLIKFLSVVIPIVALVFLLTHTTKRGMHDMQKLRGVVRKDLHHLDRLIEKSFDIMKEDLNESINILERAGTKRKLTAEENTIVHRLRQNLVDAEKIIHKEVLHAEKDIGD